MNVSFSQKVKGELGKIKEVGKLCKSALAYGVHYGTVDSGGVKSLIDDRVLKGRDSEVLGGIFLRGVFTACGSVSDPAKDYHLELVPPNDEKATELLDFVSSRGLSMKKSKRGSQTFIYCKESEQIADFLTFIGATRHSMKLMDVMILKGIRNNVNRAVNCESANIEKATRAAGRQIRDIEYIFGLESASKKPILPDKLREVATVRRANPEMPLAEIGELLKIPLSKSGVNHRLAKISEIAERLREKPPL